MTGDGLGALQSELGRLGRDHTAGDVARAMRGLGMVVTDRSLRETLEQLRLNSSGAGPLQELLELPGVTDVLVNGAEAVHIDRGRGLERVDLRLESEEALRRLAVRLAAAAGRRLDDAQPFVDGRLPDGTRLHAVLAPLAQPGTCVSLRVPARQTLSLDQAVTRGDLPPAGKDLLDGLVATRVPFLISGGTGSGKTTLLAALLAQVPPGERIVVVEDARELTPRHPHCVRLEGRLPNAEGAGQVDLSTLVRQALRMRPDRLVIGEVRGAEVIDLLAALNTGHEGGCGTIHANSVADVPARVEALAALGGLSRPAVHAQLASALRVVVHVARGSDGVRRVDQIGLLGRGDDGWVRAEPAVTFRDGRLVRDVGASKLEALVGRKP